MYSKGHGGNIYNEAVKYDFSVNTNPLGMPEDVKEKLKENLGNICQVYPEETCYELRKSISLKENISEHQIMCGNGASELIYGHSEQMILRLYIISLRPKGILLWQRI